MRTTETATVRARGPVLASVVSGGPGRDLRL